MRKTHDETILKMLDEGKTQKEIAKHFGVSGAAISKRVKRLRQPKVLEKLTPKERNFAEEVAKGSSKTHAAMISYDCGSREGGRALGGQLMTKPDIRTAVAELMQIHGLTKGYRVQKLKKHIDHADPNVSLKALDQSWKLEGAYAAEKHIHVTTDADYARMVRANEESAKKIIEIYEKLGMPEEADKERQELAQDRARYGSAFGDVIDAEFEAGGD